MSTTFFDMNDAAGARRRSWSHWMKQVSMPLEAWSRRRRLVTALMIAALVFGFGAYGWVVADLGGVETSRAALASSAQRLADARRSLAQLPAVRRFANVARASQGSASWTSTDGVRLVSELAADNGITLLSMEPGAVGGTGVETMRPVQLTAQTDFVHLMAFLRGLGDLPVLIVPVDVTVKRQADSLAMSATLHVFSALRPVASARPEDLSIGDDLDAEDEEDVVFYDPFALAPMLASDNRIDASQLRLVGLLRDRTRSLALLETADGAMTAQSGQQLGPERVTRLDALTITLANIASGGATRTLAMAEAS